MGFKLNIGSCESLGMLKELASLRFFFSKQFYLISSKFLLNFLLASI